MKEAIRVVVVDDHPLWRNAVRSDLESCGFQVVAEAADGREAVEEILRTKPDVVVMDLDLPVVSGVEATRLTMEGCPGTRVLMLSAFGNESDVLEAVKAGASGYLLKSSTSSEVADAVRRVRDGEPVFTASLAALVLDEFRRTSQGRHARQPLLDQELDALTLVAKGYSYEEIARKRSLSLSDIQRVMQGVLMRLQLLHSESILQEPAPTTDPHDRSTRLLATILFTDIVGSTPLAADIGDARWRDLLLDHQAVVRAELARFGGREIDTAGDGFLACFDGPTQAVRCASAIVEAMDPLGLQIRAGVHTGECERVGDALRGIAVHIGSRIADLAEAGEILVSSTVRELAAGSEIPFEDAGRHLLKGVPGEWSLFRVVRSVSAPEARAVPNAASQAIHGPT